MLREYSHTKCQSLIQICTTMAKIKHFLKGIVFCWCILYTHTCLFYLSVLYIAVSLSCLQFCLYLCKCDTVESLSLSGLFGTNIMETRHIRLLINAHNCPVFQHHYQEGCSPWLDSGSVESMISTIYKIIGYTMNTFVPFGFILSYDTYAQDIYLDLFGLNHITRKFQPNPV